MGGLDQTFSWVIFSIFTSATHHSLNTRLTREGRFLTTCQLTQIPINGLIGTVVCGGTEGDLGHHIGSVGRNRDLQLDILSRHLLTEVGNDFDVDLEGGAALHVICPIHIYYLLIHGEDTEGKVDVLSDTVLHELELTIWRNEGDGTVLIELTQTHTTMEGAIINFDTCALTTSVPLRLLLVGDEQLIVQTETTFGHTGQEGLHHNLTDDFTTEHSTRLGDEQVHTLQRIDEHLVLTVGDTFATPTHDLSSIHPPIDSTGDLRGDGAGIFLDIFGGASETNQHLHEINGTILRITVV